MRAYLLDLDFKALREQKLVLINLIDSIRASNEARELDGLLGLLDAIQDRAVEMGVNEKEVFG